MAVVRLRRRFARRASVKARKPVFVSRPSRALTRTSFSPSAGPVNGFPEVLRTTLRYQDVYSLQSATGSADQRIFRLNSLYDPDYSGGGHQPLYFDQLAAIYSSYRVRYSKLHVSFLPLTDDTDITTAGPYQVGVSANSSVTFSTALPTVGEQNNSQSALLARDKAALPVNFTMTYSPKRDMGINVMDDTVSAAVNANPSSSYYGCIFMGDLNNSSGTVKALVTITFDCDFFQQNAIAGS